MSFPNSARRAKGGGVDCFCNLRRCDRLLQGVAMFAKALGVFVLSSGRRTQGEEVKRAYWVLVESATRYPHDKYIWIG